MADFSAMEILGHDEFWAKDPAPGTVFFELGGSTLELVGREIDPEIDESSNAVMVKVNSTPDSDAEELYAVLKWGDWSTPANQKIKTLQDKTRELIAKEEADSHAH